MTPPLLHFHDMIAQQVSFPNNFTIALLDYKTALRREINSKLAEESANSHRTERLLWLESKESHVESNNPQARPGTRVFTFN